MFASIADQYDRINSIISLGRHHRWRRLAVKISGARQGHRVLDCATGTGDLAIAFKKRVGESGMVVGVDFCPEMLKHARHKARLQGLAVKFDLADAQNLPYEDNYFDLAGMAFGLRNVSNPVQALQEMARVVKPGGKVVVLELGQPHGFLKYPYYLYSRYAIPAVGGRLSGNRRAYVYLQQSSARFPAGQKFLDLMARAGRFSHKKAYALAGCIAYIYAGTVT